MRPTIVWSVPPEVDVSAFSVLKMEYGKESKEKWIQAEREKSVLGAIYVKPSLIPISPAEAPLEAAYDEEKVPNIPIDPISFMRQ